MMFCNASDNEILCFSHRLGYQGRRCGSTLVLYQKTSFVCNQVLVFKQVHLEGKYIYAGIGPGACRRIVDDVLPTVCKTWNTLRFVLNYVSNATLCKGIVSGVIPYLKLSQCEIETWELEDEEEIKTLHYKSCLGVLHRQPYESCRNCRASHEEVVTQLSVQVQGTEAVTVVSRNPVLLKNQAARNVTSVSMTPNLVSLVPANVASSGNLVQQEPLSALNVTPSKGTVSVMTPASEITGQHGQAVVNVVIPGNTVQRQATTKVNPPTSAPDIVAQAKKMVSEKPGQPVNIMNFNVFPQGTNPQNVASPSSVALVLSSPSTPVASTSVPQNSSMACFRVPSNSSGTSSASWSSSVTSVISPSLSVSTSVTLSSSSCEPPIPVPVNVLRNDKCSGRPSAKRIILPKPLNTQQKSQSSTKACPIAGIFERNPLPDKSPVSMVPPKNKTYMLIPSSMIEEVSNVKRKTISCQNSSDPCQTLLAKVTHQSPIGADLPSSPSSVVQASTASRVANTSARCNIRPNISITSSGVNNCKSATDSLVAGKGIVTLEKSQQSSKENVPGDKKSNQSIDSILANILPTKFSENEWIRCAICFYSFKTLELYKMHCTKQFCLQQIPCHICFKKFHNYYAFLKHLQTHPLGIKCHCGKATPTNHDELYMHALVCRYKYDDKVVISLPRVHDTEKGFMPLLQPVSWEIIESKSFLVAINVQKQQPGKSIMWTINVECKPTDEMSELVEENLHGECLEELPSQDANIIISSTVSQGTGPAKETVALDTSKLPQSSTESIKDSEHGCENLVEQYMTDHMEGSALPENVEIADTVLKLPATSRIIQIAQTQDQQSLEQNSSQIKTRSKTHHKFMCKQGRKNVGIDQAGSIGGRSVYSALQKQMSSPHTASDIVDFTSDTDSPMDVDHVDSCLMSDTPLASTQAPHSEQTVVEKSMYAAGKISSSVSSANTIVPVAATLCTGEKESQRDQATVPKPATVIPPSGMHREITLVSTAATAIHPSAVHRGISLQGEATEKASDSGQSSTPCSTVNTTTPAEVLPQVYNRIAEMVEESVVQDITDNVTVSSNAVDELKKEIKEEIKDEIKEKIKEEEDETSHRIIHVSYNVQEDFKEEDFKEPKEEDLNKQNPQSSKEIVVNPQGLVPINKKLHGDVSGPQYMNTSDDSKGLIDNSIGIPSRETLDSTVASDATSPTVYMDIDNKTNIQNTANVDDIDDLNIGGTTSMWDDFDSVAANSEEPGGYQCSECRQSFKYQLHLVHHIGTVHSDQQCQCYICQKKLVQARLLERGTDLSI